MNNLSDPNRKIPGYPGDGSKQADEQSQRDLLNKMFAGMASALSPAKTTVPFSKLGPIPGDTEAQRKMLEELYQKSISGTTPPFPSAERSVIEKIKERVAKGLAKYGVTTDRKDLTHAQWLKHAQEEAMDLAVYLEKVMGEYAPPKSNSIEVVWNKVGDTTENPVDGNEYLIYTLHGYCSVATHCKGFWYPTRSSGRESIVASVTHWALIPNPEKDTPVRLKEGEKCRDVEINHKGVALKLDRLCMDMLNALRDCFSSTPRISAENLKPLVQEWSSRRFEIIEPTLKGGNSSSEDPYQCYWSRRALDAEAKLKEVEKQSSYPVEPSDGVPRLQMSRTPNGEYFVSDENRNTVATFRAKTVECHRLGSEHENFNAGQNREDALDFIRRTTIRWNSGKR